jgi:hypothetical protein
MSSESTSFVRVCREREEKQHAALPPVLSAGVDIHRGEVHLACESSVASE